jgi:hypothetical protein
MPAGSEDRRPADDTDNIRGLLLTRLPSPASAVSEAWVEIFRRSDISPFLGLPIPAVSRLVLLIGAPLRRFPREKVKWIPARVP